MKARLPQGMGKGPSNNMNQMLKQATAAPIPTP